ncbi:MAG: POTRA domain-containing protein [Bdellovibrionales bacterium]
MIVFSSLPLFAVEFSNAIPPNVVNELRSENPEWFKKPISATHLDKIIKWLHNKVEAKSITAKRRNGDIFIDLEQTPIVSLIQLKLMKPAELISEQNILDNFPIKQGDIFNSNKIKESIQSLKVYLASRSYVQAKIDVEASVKTNRSVELILKVDTGPISRIDAIKINSTNSDLNRFLEDEVDDFENAIFNETSQLQIANKIKSELINEMYLKASIGDANVSLNRITGKVKVSYQIIEPKKYSLSFSGNEVFSQRDYFDSLELDTNSSFGVDIGNELRNKILTFLTKKAYGNANVTVSVKNTEIGYQIRFNISEGKQVKINQLNISGNFSRKEKYYRSQIEKLSSRLIRADRFYQADLEKGVKSLRILLQNQGYLSAEVRVDRIKWGRLRNYVDVFIRVEEGPLTRLKKVNFTGLDAFTREDILNYLDLVEGQPLNLNQIEQSIPKLKEYYLKRAYLDFKFDTKNTNFVVYSKDNRFAELNFTLFEGDQIKVKSIFVKGNKNTKSSIISKSLDFEKEDLLTLGRIRNSERNLQRLGLFAGVEIRPLPSNDGNRSVLVIVRERDPGVFSFGFGINNDPGADGSAATNIKLFSGLIYKNLLGEAKIFQTRLEIQEDVIDQRFLENKIVFSYVEPFLFASKVKGRVDLSFSQTLDENTSVSSSNVFVEEEKKIDFLLEKEMNEHFTFKWKFWGIRGTRKFDIDDKSTIDPLQVASLGPILEWDYRDLPILTTEGSFIRWQLEFSSPSIGSSDAILFGRSTMTLNQYFPLRDDKKLVFAYQFRSGYAENLGDKSVGGIPEDNMFYLGGRSTIRGYNINQLPYRDFLSNGSDDSLSVSDSTYFSLIKMELRFPVYGDFYSTIFYDGGSVQVNGENINPHYMDSVGIGFQYKTPVGPINLEYGYKLKRFDDNDKEEGAWHLSIGSF